MSFEVGDVVIRTGYDFLDVKTDEVLTVDLVRESGNLGFSGKPCIGYDKQYFRKVVPLTEIPKAGDVLRRIRTTGIGGYEINSAVLGEERVVTSTDKSQFHVEGCVGGWSILGNWEHVSSKSADSTVDKTSVDYEKLYKELLSQGIEIETKLREKVKELKRKISFQEGAVRTIKNVADEELTRQKVENVDLQERLQKAGNLAKERGVEATKYLQRAIKAEGEIAEVKLKRDDLIMSRDYYCDVSKNHISMNDILQANKVKLLDEIAKRKRDFEVVDTDNDYHKGVIDKLESVVDNLYLELDQALTKAEEETTIKTGTIKTVITKLFG